MRFLHLADLHLGKSIYGVSLLESGDQPHWVRAFLEKAEALRPDAVVVAGDVYDRSAPSGDAVALLSRLLTGLSDMGVPVMLAAGNHDSAQRLAFARGLLSRQGVHISRPLGDGPALASVALEDEHGPVTFWLMPYVFPALAARALGEEGPLDYDGAVRALLGRQGIDFSQRNVLVAHQNVTVSGVESPRGGSESTVGGVGQVEYTAFDGFDYVALGHIHAAYAVGRPEVRYAGSPLCYHFDETRQPDKGPLLVELGAKGEAPRVTRVEIPPLHPMRQLRGAYEEIRDGLLDGPAAGEYLRVVLTDRRVGLEEAGFLRELCRQKGGLLLELTSEYRAGAAGPSGLSAGAVAERSVEALFADFVAERGGEPLDEADAALLARAGELREGADVHAAPTGEDVARLLDSLIGREGDA